MIDISPSELSLFDSYLLDLQSYVTNGELDRKFYSRWKSRIEQITEISARLDSYLASKDAQAANEVDYSKRVALHDDEYTVFRKHIDYYRSGIKTYLTEVEATLLQGDLLTKKIQEMTGFEFRTLLLVTLSEHQSRQQP
ncbi:hypothetical protein [Spirosoma rhododendri]|uniref:Uncharacterized protein n=1 Tax=Spirosoma rhododendri TaxID=2728024 RepID=A0A7L5DSV1_9BACT|nr:hypothetical protein [Spirosoma rhododendri]QJD81544.1 hypothetical protein HH216_24545 [Spirosoma rhododendri]